MAKSKSNDPVFRFCKENRTDQEFTLKLSEIKEKYLEYLKSKDKSWITYYGHASVNFFVGDKEHGLNSVADNADYEQLQNLLMSTRHEYVDSL